MIRLPAPTGRVVRSRSWSRSRGIHASRWGCPFGTILQILKVRNPGTPCSCPVPAPPSSAGILISYSVSTFSCFFPRYPGGRTASWNPPGLHMTGQVAAIRNDCWAVPHGTERAVNRSAAGGSSMQGFAAEYAAGDMAPQGCYPNGHESRSAESGLPQIQSRIDPPDGGGIRRIG